MKLDVIICARGNSKGIPKKNKKKFNGKTLIQILLEKINRSKLINNIFVSSEDTKILEISEIYGAKNFGIRPKKLSADNVRQVDVINHLIKKIEINQYNLSKNILLLQTTSPLITKNDIESSIKLHASNNKPLISVSKEDINPTSLFVLENNKSRKIFCNKKTNQRQNQPTLFLANGAIRIFDLRYFKKNNKLLPETNITLYEIPKNRSINLDTMNDWRKALKYIKKEKS